ncbi:LysM domain-containing protein, partial [Streptomyces sp. WAC05292]|uniref:LysM peptidoglycan-binding domain-containing protein n=2 Tax=Streptomyces TaxID=1883 RepID=UPI000FBEB857
ARRYGLAGRMHVVRAGDTLAGIARKRRVEGGAQALYEANRAVVGPRPEALAVGVLLVLPPPPAPPAPVERPPSAVPGGPGTSSEAAGGQSPQSAAAGSAAAAPAEKA